MSKRPIIIDTDPGVDDTIAILLAAASNEIDIKAITPVAGNVDYETISQNAIRLADKLNINCKVGIGADQPLLIKNKTAGDIHGQGGLAGFILPTTARNFDGYAWDIINQEAISAGGELEIVTLGPLTNIAITLLRYPQIKPLIKRIVCMAGSGYMGNMNAYAEFNVWVDPDACDIVFSSGIPIVMCGLDGNEPCGLTIDELKEYIGLNTKQSDLIDHIFNFFIKRRGEPGQKDNNQVINDAITMAYLINDKIGKTEDMYVAVETKGSLSVGQTVVDRLNKYKKQPNASVLISSDKKLFKEMLHNAFAYYK